MLDCLLIAKEEQEKSGEAALVLAFPSKPFLFSVVLEKRKRKKEINKPQRRKLLSRRRGTPESSRQGLKRFNLLQPTGGRASDGKTFLQHFLSQLIAN